MLTGYILGNVVNSDALIKGGVKGEEKGKG
jgi:hypothetical protein